MDSRLRQEHSQVGIAIGNVLARPSIPKSFLGYRFALAEHLGIIMNHSDSNVKGYL